MGFEPLRSLPNEIKEMITEEVTHPVSLEEAKRIRERLMKERSSQNLDDERTYRSAEWGFCEH
jgi:hypothetical protein